MPMSQRDCVFFPRSTKVTKNRVIRIMYRRSNENHRDSGSISTDVSSHCRFSAHLRTLTGRRFHSIHLHSLFNRNNFQILFLRLPGSFPVFETSLCLRWFCCLSDGIFSRVFVRSMGYHWPVLGSGMLLWMLRIHFAEFRVIAPGRTCLIRYLGQDAHVTIGNGIVG
jgi:hypothetical protein